ncbi:neuronal acetylcholine receptor subunit alpha-7-like [Penaeus japonicus]|uniref:neuronal acetylcholine receptor subunit alpha-7-like n=1 Tax=Penaeus japonicus TaxID=27405 RepID=UPI001C713E40|nr:neuronal acetylcholine receptor subunit alpha-7-like [Penaeus japonicus]XP_042894093.1 neuronal acetylcholine receptor subunit alpha-7-like [Penaeus japonicus]XP_042894170.1 neuronal acetylcholine receptor subunit alpha-7-like [Penaeus japonicus]
MRAATVYVVLMVFTAVWADGETELREALRTNYDKSALPDTKTVVTISSFRILDFYLAEGDHIASVLCWFGHSWMDPRLQWKKEDYKFVDRLSFDPDTIWRPDLSLYNGASEQHFPQSNLPVLVYAEGKVLYVPSYTLDFYCITDMTYWPHDSHTCSLKIGSWVHHGHLLDIQTNGTVPKLMLGERAMDSGQIITKTAWELSDMTMTRDEDFYACCPEPYVSITISVLATRNAPTFAWIVKVPVICMSLLTVVVFLLPPAAGEKIVFGGLCLVMNIIFVDYAVNAIGHSPSHTPLIIQMVCQQMVLVMLSVIVSGLVIRMARGPHSSGLPNLFKRPALFLSSCLCLGSYSELASKSSHTFGSARRKPDELELGEEGSPDLRRRETGDAYEWLLLAAVVDRLALLLYVAICVISLIRFSSVL